MDTLTISSQTNIMAYIADWAGSIDNWRTTNDYVIFYGKNLVSWSAKKQLTMARSSTKTKFQSITGVAPKLMWIKNLLQEIGFRQNPS